MKRLSVLAAALLGLAAVLAEPVPAETDPPETSFGWIPLVQAEGPWHGPDGTAPASCAPCSKAGATWCNVLVATSPLGAQYVACLNANPPATAWACWFRLPAVVNHDYRYAMRCPPAP